MAPLCRFGYNCWRPDCWLRHPEGRAYDVQDLAAPSSFKSFPPCEQDAQLVVLWENEDGKDKEGSLQRLHVLLQLRCTGERGCHLAAVGCKRHHRDVNSRHTVLREASETPGLVELGLLEGAPVRYQRRARALRASRPRDILKFGSRVNYQRYQ